MLGFLLVLIVKRLEAQPSKGHLLKAGESKLGQRGVSVCGGEDYRI